jgi:hypothetical protein
MAVVGRILQIGLMWRTIPSFVQNSALTVHTLVTVVNHFDTF